MGKRKRGKTQKTPEQDNEENELINPHAEGFYRDEVDEFHAQKEKILLERSGYLEPASSTDEELSDNEVEVLGLELSDHESGEEEERNEVESKQLFYESEDDELDGEEDQPPEISEKAWGHSKQSFYSTDYVDDDLGGSSEEEEAEMEEREAMAIQQRMAAALQEQDFEVPEIIEGGDEIEDAEVKEERVIQDLSKLSRDEKLALLEKDSPELFDLLEEFHEKFSEAVNSLHPLVQTVRSDPTRFTQQAVEFLEVKLQLYLCYCVNIMFYLRLKACKTHIQNHPVIGRIVQIRQLIGQLKSLDKKVEPQMKKLLEVVGNGLQNDNPSASESGREFEEQPKETRKRKQKRETSSGRKSIKLDATPKDLSVEATEKQAPVGEDPLEYYERMKAEKRARKKAREEGRDRQFEGQEEGEEEEGKRAITYQIARNKGLTPKRKKEQRNPRVRHRKKYKKAVIKRKSQVLPVVPELDRYGGERTGIRANLTRSVKIK